MEMKYVVPDMAQSFGTLEFAGESEPVFERDKNNRKVIARRSYNLYSDVDNQLNIIQVADLVLPDKDTTFNEYTTIELLSVAMLIVISTFALDFIHSDRRCL